MTHHWPIVVAVLVLYQLSCCGCGALKIQRPEDDLPRELNHPKQIQAIQVGYLNLDTVLSALYEEDNLEANKELINGLLESELKRPTLLKSVDKLKDTVELFHSLTVNYENCNYDGYKSLAQNYRAVDGRSHELFERRRAIEMMIYDLALEHARECGPKYVQLFEEIAERPAAKVVSQVVDEVLKGLDADSLLTGEDGGRASQFRLEDVVERDVAGLDLANYAFHTIVKNIEGLVQGKSEANSFYPELGKGKSAKPTLPKKFETDIFRKYLIVPCEQYNELFREVFAPARFDALLEPAQVGIAPIFPSESDRFNKAFVQYRVCKHLAGWADTGDILSIVQQVAKSLSKRPTDQ